jgi:hypothetical protein
VIGWVILVWPFWFGHFGLVILVILVLGHCGLVILVWPFRFGHFGHFGHFGFESLWLV